MSFGNSFHLSDWGQKLMMPYLCMYAGFEYLMDEIDLLNKTSNVKDYVSSAKGAFQKTTDKQKQIVNDITQVVVFNRDLKARALV